MSEATMRALEQADDLLARGKIKQAIDALRASVREEPDNRRALNRLGDLYVRSGQQDRAIAMFRRIGGDFEEDGLAAQAIALYKKVVRIDPEQWDAYERLGDLYHGQKLPFEAASQYERAARAYLRSKDSAAAIRALKGVVENRPADADARARLAEIYLSTRRIPQAMDEYAQIGELMLAAGQPDQALQMYIKVLESNFDADFGQRAVKAMEQAGESGTSVRLAALVDQLAGQQKTTLDTETAELTTGVGDEVLELDLDEQTSSAELPLGDEPAEVATVDEPAVSSIATDEDDLEVAVEASATTTEATEAEEQADDVFEIDLSEFENVEPLPSTASEAAGSESATAGEAARTGDLQDLTGLGSQVQDSLMVAQATGADAESDSIEGIVAGFTQGLAAALSPDDFDTHYNLGLGYQEMGLIDEAIGEFQIAAKSPQHLINAASMLGYAFRERGLYDLAYEWYERARESDVASEEQRLAMRYEQAETQYEAEEIERAYELYQEVYGVDSTFRDVAQRIDELRTG